MDDVKLDNLAKAYVESREEMWQVLAEKVGEKRAVVESKVSSNIDILKPSITIHNNPWLNKLLISNSV